jgi:hypothetical protein
VDVLPCRSAFNSVRHRARLVSCSELSLDVARQKLGWRDDPWLQQRFMSRILRGLNDDDLTPVTAQVIR